MEALSTTKTIRLSKIYKQFFPSYLASPKKPVSKAALKAVNQTMACRTSRIGVNVYQCSCCKETKYVLRSCKNRFCPRCGYSDTKLWASNLLEKLAPCSHHHIVFTLPAMLRGLGLRNKKEVHSLLLRSSAETIQDWFQHKYGITPGIINVLHTAGSDQKYHPHAHMICSTGGLNKEGEYKLINKSWYLVNQKFLSKKFRWHFEKGLIDLFDKNKLKTSYPDIISFKRFVKSLNSQNWVISVQGPLNKAEDIVNYVGRYSKRACISERNILEVKGDYIRFRHKNYKEVDHRGQAMMTETTLHYRDFLGRLLEHVPEKGFRVVRYYGVYINSKLKQLHKSLGREVQKHGRTSWRDYQKEKTGIDPLLCVHCQEIMDQIGVEYDLRPYYLRVEVKRNSKHGYAA